jgi:hypothetical protein
MDKSPNANGRRCSLPQLRGAKARRWRRRLASSAARPQGTVRTLKFKLALSDGVSVDFDDVRGLNRIVDGVGRGSLTGLLLAVHCGGFRIFMQEAGAKRFRESASGDGDGFAAEFERNAGFTLRGFDPPGLRERFAKRPRARGGKDISFVPSVIANEYARHFAGKAVVDLDPERKSFFEDWADLLHAEFVGEADGWIAIEAQPDRAAATVGALFRGRGWSLPAIAAPSQASAKSIWPACVLAYDPTQPLLDPESGTALYAVVALRIAQLRRAGLAFDDKIRGPLQETITTQTSAGLSWLFGTGLGLLRSAGIAEAATGLAVPPEGTAALERVLVAARTIGSDPLFGAKGYADYRRIVGGRLDSWVANYVNRLLELQQMLDGEPARFVLPEKLVSGWSRWFGRTPLTADGVQNLLDMAHGLRKEAHYALAALTGETGELITEETVATIQRYADIASEAAGALRTLANVLSPDNDHRDGTRRDPAMPTAALVKPPDWLKELPKLNDFSGAIPDYEQELADAAREYQRLTDAYAAAYTKIEQTVDDVKGGLSAAAIARLRDNASADPRNPGGAVSAAEQALRQVLHRFARVAIACGGKASQAVRDLYLSWGVFKEGKDANKLFVNRTGALFRSWYARSRHEPYALGTLNIDPDELIAAMRNFAHGLVPGGDHGLGATETLRLRQAADALALSGLTQACPRAWFPAGLDERYVRVPVAFKLAMQSDQLSPDVVARYFNLLLAARLSTRALLERQRFFVRARFQRVGDTQLCYRPKDTTWLVPNRLLKTKKPIGEAVRRLVVDGRIRPAELLDTTLKAQWADPTLLPSYLRQAPHDWHYVPGLAATEKTGGWLVVDGKSGRAGRTSKQGIAGRLVGPPSYKSELDRLLAAKPELTFGDLTVIFDQEYLQKLEQSPSGEPMIGLTRGAMTISIAVPLSSDAEPASVFPYADRVLSIDQGEAGIGFAVHEVKTKRLIAAGSRRIPSIRRLIRKAKQYRGIGPKSQKFQQRFDSTMFVMRENVVGDICQAICQLMHGYQAFPVLESQVGNLEGGSRQLDLVYKAVTARFCFSDVPAQSAERVAFWVGGDRWQHPYLLTEAWNEDGKKAGKLKPLNLFPGARGPTAGTSQQCSRCGRNPIRELWQCVETGVKTLAAEQGGHVTLPSGTVLLCQATEDSVVFKAARRRNERVPIDQPIASGDRPTEELISLARRNLRQAPKSRQSTDTTQSVYQCLYVDCHHRMHADENAAINIGRRFLEEKVNLGA